MNRGFDKTNTFEQRLSYDVQSALKSTFILCWYQWLFNSKWSWCKCFKTSQKWL